MKRMLVSVVVGFALSGCIHTDRQTRLAHRAGEHIAPDEVTLPTDGEKNTRDFQLNGNVFTQTDHYISTDGETEATSTKVWVQQGGNWNYSGRR